MSDISPSAIRALEKAIDSKKSKSSRKRESSQSAVITRVDENGMPWFHIPGGASETPAKYSAVDVAKGDVVNVTVQNGYARIDGNISAPAASDRTVQKVTVTLREETQGIFEKLDAEKATIKDLRVVKADIDELDASTAHIENGVITNATIDQANVTGLTAAYAQIDAANIDTATIRNAWADQILVQTGLIAHEADIFTLDAIQVDAANITAGTIDVQRLIVTVDGHKYMVHIDPETSQPTYQKLDGDIVEDLTITADKIVAGAITAQKITTENLVGTGGWINLHSGTFAYSSPLTGQGISWDGSNLSIVGSVTVGGSSISLNQFVEDSINLKIEEVYDNLSPHQSVTLNAHLYRGATEITTQYSANAFAWYIKKESTVAPVPLDPSNGYSHTLSVSEAGFGAAVVCNFTPPNDAGLLTEDDDELTDSNDEPLSVRVASGDHVRVSDLTVETTVFDTDKVMLVGAEDEHLVSIATLKDTFGDGDYERLDNKPSIEGVTLSGNKDFPDLGIFQTDSQGYSVPDEYTLTTMDINALWANAAPIGA